MGERCGMQKVGEVWYCLWRSRTAQMGHVEYKFIYEMSFLFSDNLVNFTCNHCCVWLLLQPACSKAILHASVVLFLIWKDMIGGKKKIYPFHFHRLPARDNNSLDESQSWFSSFWMWPICGIFVFSITVQEDPLFVMLSATMSHWI